MRLGLQLYTWMIFKNNISIFIQFPFTSKSHLTILPFDTTSLSICGFLESVMLFLLFLYLSSSLPDVVLEEGSWSNESTFGMRSFRDGLSWAWAWYYTNKCTDFRRINVVNYVGIYFYLMWFLKISESEILWPTANTTSAASLTQSKAPARTQYAKAQKAH